ncbi:LysM peptidoglycan-binding domain-containing protein [Bacillus sp. 1P06AnD]|uniref:LysM peptidoglycan-binding domain-containing protein n=1 Tax=Bacillus sp. 1P06AnD TaxID=3132208 RepID=UPI0039A0C199
MSNQNQSCLRFALEESIWFRKGQEVQELYSLAIEPEVTISERNQYIVIEGSLQVTGEYGGNRESQVWNQETGEVQDLQQHTVHGVMRREDDGVFVFQHHFPVDISIPSSRVDNRHAVEVDIASFDYHLPEKNCLKLMAELVITGIYDGERDDALVQTDYTEEQPLQDMEEEEYDAIQPISIQFTQEESASRMEEDGNGEYESFTVEAYAIPEDDKEEMSEPIQGKNIQVPEFIRKEEETEEEIEEGKVEAERELLGESGLVESARLPESYDWNHSSDISSQYEDIPMPNFTREDESQLLDIPFPAFSEMEGRADSSSYQKESVFEEIETISSERKEELTATESQSHHQIYAPSAFIESGDAEAPSIAERKEESSIYESPLESIHALLEQKEKQAIHERIESSFNGPPPPASSREDQIYESSGARKGVEPTFSSRPESPLEEPIDRVGAQPESSSQTTVETAKKSVSLTDFFAKKETQTQARLRVCIVQNGETLTDVASRYSLNKYDIIACNNMKEEEDIQEGQVLYIPKKTVHK